MSKNELTEFLPPEPLVLTFLFPLTHAREPSLTFHMQQIIIFNKFQLPWYLLSLFFLSFHLPCLPQWLPPYKWTSTLALSKWQLLQSHASLFFFFFNTCHIWLLTEFWKHGCEHATFLLENLQWLPIVQIIKAELNCLIQAYLVLLCFCFIALYKNWRFVATLGQGGPSVTFFQ